jgi:Ni/Co efflux regulator RcnB
MKKIVLLLAVLLFGAGSMMAQQDKSAEKAAKQAEKERKQRRQRRKLRRKPRLTHCLNKRCKL